MKTRNNKLAFNKNSITELNDAQISEIMGGTDTINQSTIQCSHCIPDTSVRISLVVGNQNIIKD